MELCWTTKQWAAPAPEFGYRLLSACPVSVAAPTGANSHNLMPRSSRFSLLSTLALSVTLCAQDDVGAVQPGSRPLIQLHYTAFDPLVGEPPVAGALSADADSRLCLVQFNTEPTDAHRDALRRAGAEVHWYAPHQAYVVRHDATKHHELAALSGVRWVGAMHPAYKLQPSLLAELTSGATLERRTYILVLVDPRADEPAIVAAVTRVGGEMWRYSGGNILIEAKLTAAQTVAMAHEDSVLWMQVATAPETDMDNARVQGGGNYVQAAGGHTGKGVRGHIMEGIYNTHPEFAANAYRTAPVAVFSGVATTHGNSTFGEIFSSGVLPAARGMCPDGQGYFTDYNYIFATAAGSNAQNSRYGVVREITDPTKQWKVMFQTASWGFPQITTYDARSAEMDWVIHQFDIPICQSQSNTSNQTSRPQAWAKNIISVGALNHLNTASPNDDTQSGTSMGPATDLRIKPDLCAYYDGIHTTNGATTYTTGFGGTSGATPMVAGHLGLMLELYTDGLFGHPAAPTWQDRFAYKPHFSTAKALLINTARQYDPAINGAGATSRFRQGWGFPALNDLYDLRNNILVLNELDVLRQGQTRTYFVHVKPGTPQFRATMVYADLPTAPNFLSPHRVNDLNLRVRDPNGVVYHGNNGMAPTTMTSANLYTTPGGSPNGLDTVENVYVRTPQHGVWQLDVSAPLVALDQHVETPAVDADFALVASGIAAGRDRSGPVLDLVTGPGTLTLSITNNPATYTDGYVMFSLATTLPYAMGNFLGLEADALALSSLTSPAAVGNVFHFLPAGAGVFPNAPFVFPGFIVTILQGRTLDAVGFYFNAGQIHASTNVDRVTVQ